MRLAHKWGVFMLRTWGYKMKKKLLTKEEN